MSLWTCTLFTKLYKAIIRPHLEYAQSVWNPNWKMDINRIENVQRRATKLVPGLKDLEYDDRLRKLKLPTLVYRRLRGDLIECYKMVSGIYDNRVANFLKLSEHVVDTSVRRRGHGKKLYVKQAKHSTRTSSFAYRVNDTWNNLPAEVVNAPSVNSFKNRLDSHWSEEDIMYDFTKSLNKFESREQNLGFLNPLGIIKSHRE